MEDKVKFIMDLLDRAADLAESELYINEVSTTHTNQGFKESALFDFTTTAGRGYISITVMDWKKP